jgi:uncharacterized phage protein (TIGR01671 family)
MTDNRRIIKFRAWSKSLNRMIWGPSVGTVNTGWVYALAESVGYENEIILMQFTGIMDKNGKEIYEGDIVHYMFDFDDEKLQKKAKRYKGNVYWDDEHAGWVVGPHRLVFNNGNFCQVEVIGNIYEKADV